MPSIEPERSWTEIDVSCGVLENEAGEILIAQRPVGKVAAGKWEFPGGKVEPGESERTALSRELEEELGVQVSNARFLGRLRQDYAGCTVWLNTWRVESFRGTPVAREVQKLAWVTPEKVPHYDLLPSCWRVLVALRLPRDYVFTPPTGDLDDWLPAVSGLPDGAQLRLRRPHLDDDRYCEEAKRLLPACRSHRIGLILDRDPAWVQILGAAGWHADGRVLHAVRERPLPREYWCLASGHGTGDLQRAWQAGMDAAVLGPVQLTASHPGMPPLGWNSFARAAGRAGLPVYAIGGIGPAQYEVAMAHGASGVAGISAYWPSSSPLRT